MEMERRGRLSEWNRRIKDGGRVKWTVVEVDERREKE